MAFVDIDGAPPPLFLHHSSKVSAETQKSWSTLPKIMGIPLTGVHFSPIYEA